MKKNNIFGIVPSTIITLAFIIGIGSSANAEPTPLKVTAPYPTKNELTQQAGQAFIEQAYEAARMNSPFASFDATVEGADASDINDSLTGVDADDMLSYAARFLGTRYRLGATGPKAFDCSGFTGYVFRKFGIQLNRTSREQYKQGTKVSKNDLRPGDLLFFSNRSSGRGRVGHVAIVSDVDPETGKCRFIHASTKRGVTYQTFPDGGYYDRHFIGAKRFL